MAIKDWHEDDRPREKLLKFGAAHLSDAEILAIFLRTGTQSQSAIELARHGRLGEAEEQLWNARLVAGGLDRL